MTDHPHHPHHHVATPWRFAMIIALMSTLAPFSIDTYLPSFPDIMTDLGATPLQMQQTLSLYLLGFGAMMLAHGPLSDACGRKPVVLWSLAAYAAASVGAALARDIETLLVMRTAEGLAAGASMVIGRAVIRDAFAGAAAQRLMAQVTMIFAVAPAIAPIIGGWLHDLWGWRAVFWFLAALGTGVGVLVAWRLPETLPLAGRQPLHPAAVARTYWRVLRNPRFLALVSVVTCNFGGMFLYISSVPVLLFRDLGYRADEFGWFFVPVVSGIVIGSFLSSRLAHRLGAEGCVRVAYLVLAVAITVNLLQASLLTPTTPVVVIPVMLYAIGMSLAAPAISLLALDEFPLNRGLASAVQGSVQTFSNAAIAGLLSPLLSAHIFGLAAGMAALAAGGYLLWRLVPAGRRQAEGLL